MAERARLGKVTDRELLARLWAWVQPYRRMLGIAIAFNCLGVVATLMQPLLLKSAIDDHIAIGALDGISLIIGLFVGVVAIGFGSRAIGYYLTLHAGLQTLATLRRNVYRHVMGQGQRFFDTHTTGSLLTRSTSDVDAVYESMALGAVNLVTDALTIIGVLIAMLILDPMLTLVAFALAPVIIGVVELFRRRLRTLYLVVRKALSHLNGFFAEQIHGMSVVQLYGAQDHATTQFRTMSYKYLDAYRRSNWWDAGLYAIMDGMSSLAIGLMLWFGATQYIDPASGVTLGLLVAFVDYLQRVFVPIRDFSGRFATVQRAVAALERIVGLLEANDRVTPGSIDLSEADASARISFDGVKFRYREELPDVLADVSFEMQSGEVVAMVGSTGSGKTTIGKLLNRMYDGYDGRIEIGGHELRELTSESLRRHISVVHQDVHLFHGSIGQNISLWADDVDQAGIERAAELSRAADFIADMPEGYDSAVAERGANLSAGQRQLVAIARAMARDAPIVVLDEATASVDSMTERLVDEAIEELFARKTVLVIAHRLSTITKADRILVLHRGRVVEQGTHEQLIAMDGRYRLLVETGFAV